MRTSPFFYLTVLSAFGNHGYLTQASLQIPFSPSPNALPTTTEKATAGESHGWDFDLQSLEPVALALNGDPKNRVDLVYFGDGYAEEERETFLRDARLLTETLLNSGGAFSPVANLLNFWAVFIPSAESGIGNHGKPKNTTFGLYRPGEELRAVFYAHPERVAAACKALNSRSMAQGERAIPYGCDEPILLGNDGFYGGLGGTPTVITASRNNGVQVLRHELGHTLIPVGEEYDGGYAYFGVNAVNASSKTAKQNVSWTHWLSNEQARRTGRVRLEDSRVAIQKYPWHDLTQSPYAVEFKDHGDGYPTGLLRFSVSGVPTEANLVVKMDGNVVKYTFDDEHCDSLDRTWVQVPLEKGLASLNSKSMHHKLEFTATAASETVRPMLSSLEIIEYGSEERFNSSAGHVGAYRTEDIDGGVTLRPTNEGCLMRDVTVPTFCPVCLEGLTLSLLGRVSLIESTQTKCPPLGRRHISNHASISLALLNMTDATYTVRWFQGDIELNAFENKTTLEVPVSLLQPEWITEDEMYTARVRMSLPHVRLEGREEMQEEAVIRFGGCE